MLGQDSMREQGTTLHPRKRWGIESWRDANLFRVQLSGVWNLVSLLLTWTLPRWGQRNKEALLPPSLPTSMSHGSPLRFLGGAGCLVPTPGPCFL